jgi:hypothetical protein
MRLRRGQINYALFRRLKVLDYGILLAGAIAVVFVSVFAYAKNGSELSVIIGGSQGEWIYPLGEDRTLNVEGPVGTTLVEIHENRVHILGSPCKNQTCVAAGAIGSEGQWLACLPNKVFVRIEGKNDNDKIDASVF